ncbi:hypothetical protein [Nitratifractor sp.]
MERDKRILALCSNVEQLDGVVEKTGELAKRYGAGVTLLYVKEERLFELPLFEKSDGSVEDLARILREELRRHGYEEWAVLAYENDLVDHARLEAERERSFLVVSDEHEEVDKLVSALKRPLLILRRESSHHYDRVLVALDSASSSERGLDFVKGLVGEAQLHCIMDYQMLISLADPTIDPVVGAMTPDLLVEEENEVIQAARQSFEELCRRQGIEGRFTIGEKGLVEDLLDEVSAQEPDLLALVVEDPDTLMAEAAEMLALRTPCDLLVCYNSIGE